MKSNRRAFLKTSVVTAAAIGAFPAILNAGELPSEKIVVGLIGCGAAGLANLKTFISQPNVECGALCDSDSRILQKIAAETAKIQHKKPVLYTDYRRLLDNNEIDVALIATPEAWHSEPFIYACQRGKDIYIETPLAGSIQECNEMVAAQKKYNNVVQVGQWQRSQPHWNAAAGYLKAGRLGQVQSVHAWSHHDISFLNDNPNSSDLLTTFGLPLLGFAGEVLQVADPLTIVSTGGNFTTRNKKPLLPDTMMTTYDFSSARIFWDHSCGIKNGHYNQKSGVAFIGEYGVLVINEKGWKVIPGENAHSNGFDGIPFQKASDNDLQLHVQNFLNGIKSRKNPNCTIEAGAKAAKLCLLGNVSYRIGKKIKWDESKQECINNHKANRLICPSDSFRLSQA